MTPSPRLNLRMVSHRNPRRFVAIAAIIVAATALAGCTSGNGASDSRVSSEDVRQVPPGEIELREGELGAQDGSTTNRDVISTASVSLVSSDPADATERAVDIATDAGGRVDNRTDSPATNDSGASGMLTLRIPADNLDDALEEIKAIGDLQHASLNATDVTDQVTDLDARITALSASVDRLLALIGTASSTADLIDLEGALSSRQAELDSLEAQRDAIGDAVEYATVTVEIASPAVVVGSAAPGDFWGGIVVGFTSLLTFVSGLLVVLGVLIPWLIVAVVIAAVVWLLVRRTRAGRGQPQSHGHGDAAGYGPGQPAPPPPSHPLDPERFPLQNEPAAQPGTEAPPRPALPVDDPRTPGAPGTPDARG